MNPSRRSGRVSARGVKVRAARTQTRPFSDNPNKELDPCRDAFKRPESSPKNISARVGDDDPTVYTDGGERWSESDSPGSPRVFLDDSEGQVVVDPLNFRHPPVELR